MTTKKPLAFKSKKTRYVYWMAWASPVGFGADEVDLDREITTGIELQIVAAKLAEQNGAPGLVILSFQLLRTTQE